jgi:ATP-dependent protease ClpP protease subunit
MTAAESKAYGLVDDILTRPPINTEGEDEDKD